MLKLNSFILSSKDPDKLVEFYNKVLEKDKPDWAGEKGEFSGYMIGDCFVGIGPDDRIKGKNPEPYRLMFNLETTEVEKEFDRIKKLGAEVIAEPYSPGEDSSMKLATFADPDGNYFQLASPMPS